jgi:hypothetical protein
MSKAKFLLPLFQITYLASEEVRSVHTMTLEAKDADKAQTFWIKHFPTFPFVSVVKITAPTVPMKVYEITWVEDEESDGEDVTVEAPDLKTAFLEFMEDRSDLHEVKIECFPNHQPLLPLTDPDFNAWLGKVILELRKQYSEWAYKFELDVVKDVLDRRQNWREDFTSKHKIEDVCYFFLGDPPDEDEDAEE